MHSYGSDHEVLQAAYEGLQQGYEVVLVTVLKTWGSSPRPAGSLMVIRSDGQITGSVSGGCVEQDLVQRCLNKQFSDDNLTRIDYGTKREDMTRLGLPCGGRLELLVEKFADVHSLEPLLNAFEQQRMIARQVDLQTGKVVLQEARVEQDFAYTGLHVRKIYGPQWNMLLIGAGHLSQYVSHLALMLGYRVIVCDPREEYAQGWTIEGTELTGMMPDDAVVRYANQARSIVLALSHDPKLDDMALLDALQSTAFYVGAIGSQRNCELRRERLKQLGLSSLQLQRLRAPVGLPIGSHTPAEMAISILAEITQRRNKKSTEQGLARKQTVRLV